MSDAIKILFMGTPEIATVMLARLLEDGYRVIGVVSQPDKKVGRKQLLQMPPVKEMAIQHHIPVYQPIHIMEEYESFDKLSIDLIVTCAYGQFIPEKLLSYPTYGSINVHTSLLPKLRGGAPIHKAIINGETKTGVSIMRMVKKMDAGDVMAQCVVPIDPIDTMGSLYTKLAKAGAELLSTSIPEIIEGKAEFKKQNEKEATFAYTISKEEEFISFHRPVIEVYNHIRGLLPTPCGYARINGKKLKIHKVRMVESAHGHPAGEVVGLLDDGFAIACEGGYILADELQLEGKAKVEANAFYNGSGKALIGKVFDEEI